MSEAALKSPKIRRLPSSRAKSCFATTKKTRWAAIFPSMFGRSRLWHGGIHLNLPQVRRCLRRSPDGLWRRGLAMMFRRVANFVLMRHYFRLVGVDAVFHPYMHVEREEPKSGRTPWLFEADKSRSFRRCLPAAFYPDIGLAVKPIGHVGHAGPPGNYEGQIHVEVMSPKTGSKLERVFSSIDGKSSGHFCDVRDIVSAIDRPKGKGDGILTEKSCATFPKRPGQLELRKLAVRFQSEWGDANDWEQQLKPEQRLFARCQSRCAQKMYRDQIKPTLWYTAEAEKSVCPRLCGLALPSRALYRVDEQPASQASDDDGGQIQVARGRRQPKCSMTVNRLKVSPMKKTSCRPKPVVGSRSKTWQAATPDESPASNAPSLTKPRPKRAWAGPRRQFVRLR